MGILTEGLVPISCWICILLAATRRESVNDRADTRLMAQSSARSREAHDFVMSRERTVRTADMHGRGNPNPTSKIYKACEIFF